MKLYVGRLYYFWNAVEEKVSFLTVTAVSGDSFEFTMGPGKKGKCKYKDMEGKLFEDKWAIPEFRAMCKQNNTDKGTEEITAYDTEFDNLVGFEHRDMSGEYKYYPSIYYYQGSDDTLSHGSVYDVEEADDLGL